MNLIFNLILQKYVFYYLIYKHSLYLYIKNVSSIQYVFNILKRNTFCLFSFLVDICIIDYPWRQCRFELSYNLISLQFNKRLFCKLFISELTNLISISSFYKAGSWLERELWDTFGVFFFGHNDLRRILTDYGFNGYPLRKDFPLTGFLELQYDEDIMSLKYVPVELTQDYRSFNFLSPWEEV